MTEQRLPILQLCRMSTWSTWSWSQRRRASRGGSNGRCEAAVGQYRQLENPNWVLQAAFQGQPLHFILTRAKQAHSCLAPVLRGDSRIRRNTMNHRVSMKRRMIPLAGTAIGLACWIPAQAQESRWANADDATATS